MSAAVSTKYELFPQSIELKVPLTTDPVPIWRLTIP